MIARQFSNFTVLSLFLLFSACTAGASDIAIGHVIEIHGNVQIIDVNKEKRTLRLRDALFLNDEVSTGPDGYIQLQLLDETHFTLGPNSQLVLDEFVYDPATSAGEVTTNITSGFFRFVSGKIAKTNPDKMKVNFPAGSAGIRGTTVMGEVIGDRTLVVLLETRSRASGQSHVGHIVLQNVVEYAVVETHLNIAGQGSVIEGKNSPPSEAFMLSGEELDRLTSALYSPREAAEEKLRMTRSAFSEYMAERGTESGTVSYRGKTEKRQANERKQVAAQQNNNEFIVEVDATKPDDQPTVFASIEEN